MGSFFFLSSFPFFIFLSAKQRLGTVTLIFPPTLPPNGLYKISSLPNDQCSPFPFNIFLLLLRQSGGGKASGERDSPALFPSLSSFRSFPSFLREMAVARRLKTAPPFSTFPLHPQENVVWYPVNCRAKTSRGPRHSLFPFFSPIIPPFSFRYRRW